MNLTECQTIAEVVEWVKSAPPSKDDADTERWLGFCLHQAALIGARKMQEAAIVESHTWHTEQKENPKAQIFDEQYGFGRDDAANAIRALDAAAIVKKGM